MTIATTKLKYRFISDNIDFFTHSLTEENRAHFSACVLFVSVFTVIYMIFSIQSKFMRKNGKKILLSGIKTVKRTNSDDPYVAIISKTVFKTIINMLKSLVENR